MITRHNVVSSVVSLSCDIIVQRDWERSTMYCIHKDVCSVVPNIRSMEHESSTQLEIEGCQQSSDQ